MFGLFDTNPTQIAGVLAFAVAAAACWLAARGARGSAAKAWKLLAVLQGLFLAEVVFGVRHEAHEVVNGFLQDHGWYWQRQTAQVLLLGVALVTVGVGLAAIMRWGRAHRGVLPAALASFAVAMLLALEMISLHAVDALLYFHVGSLMVIAALWVACAAVIVACAVRRR